MGNEGGRGMCLNRQLRYGGESKIRDAGTFEVNLRQVERSNLRARQGIWLRE